MHGITEQEWIDYLNRTFKGSARERQRLDQHLASCTECKELYERILHTVSSLKDAAAEIRGGFPLEANQVHASLVRVLVRILDNEASVEQMTQG